MKKIALLFALGYANNLYADARSTLTFENNCTEPVQFSINGDEAGQSYTVQLDPNQYVFAGSYVNSNTLEHTTSNIQIQFNSLKHSGRVSYLLDNGFTNNTAAFTKADGDIKIEHMPLTTDYTYTWHSYTLSGKQEIPSFTVSACKQTYDISKSDVADIQRIVIFGDSISDQGNLYHYSAGMIPKSTPYYRGMFSNGAPWSVLLKNTLKSFNIEVSNYAVGGATVVFEPEWASLGLPYNLDAELKAYQLDQKNWRKNEQKLAIFFIGANDYLTADKSLSDKDIQQISHEVTDKIINTIREVGAENTLIVGLPDLSFTPESHERGNEAVLTKLSTAHNMQLQEFANSNTNIKFIDIDKMFALLLNNPQAFNTQFNTVIDPKNNTISCWHGGYFSYNHLQNKTLNFATLSNRSTLPADITASLATSETGNLCPDPEHYIFWDHVHPTYQIQKAIYQYILNNMNITNTADKTKTKEN